MLSAKLKEDEAEDDEVEEFGHEEEEVPAEEAYEDEEIGDEEVPAEETYEDEEFGDEEVPAGDDDEEEGDLDLEAIIRELETELKEEDEAYDENAPANRDGLAEEDDAYDEKASPKKDGLAEGDDDDDEVEVDESVFNEVKEKDDDDDDDDDAVKVKEQSDSSDIGNGDNKVDVADAGDEEDPGKGDIHEVKAELQEYKEAVSYLKDKLHEVNILNAKLLFTNKLFKEYSLNNNQKLKVVETFDRAQTTREIKLVYSTLAEQFGDNSTIGKKSIKESASTSIGSTKPSKASRKVITEESQVANRFKKLAGLL